MLKRKGVDVLALSELHKTGAVAFVGVGGAAKGMSGNVGLLAADVGIIGAAWHRIEGESVCWRKDGSELQG